MATVKFSVVAKKNPMDVDAPARFYACAQSSGVQSLEDLSKVIEKNCTLTSTDVMAVLHAMDEVMRDQLSNGQIVRIGDLGYVRLALRSEGADTVESFTSAMIRKVRVVFTPSLTTQKALKVLNFTKVSTLPKKEEKSEKDEPVNG